MASERESERELLKNLVDSVKKVLDSHHAKLSGAVKSSLADFAESLYEKRLIPKAVKNKPGSYNKVMNDVKACLDFPTDIEDLKKMLSDYLDCLSDLGGAPIRAADILKEELLALALPVVCNCGEKAIKLQTKKDTLNKGRWFYKCAKDEGGGKCKFFKWANEIELSFGTSKPGIHRAKEVELRTSGVKKCGCGEPVVKRISQTEDHPRQEFLTCPKSQCRFFEWVDTPTPAGGASTRSKERARTSSIAHGEESTPPAKKRAKPTCSSCGTPGHTKRSKSCKGPSSTPG